jgi:hypothetical protein
MSGAEKLLSFAPTLKREVVGAPVSLQACHTLYTPLYLPPKLTLRRLINQPQQQGTKKSVAGGGGDG